MKFRKWQILNLKTVANKKIVATTDEVLFKSNFGHFLKVDKNHVLANNNLIADDTAFSVKRADTFSLPNWSVLRPYQSSLFFTSDCVQLFSQNNQFFSQLNYNGNKLKTNITFNSPKEAERLIIEEVIYSLMSTTGQFIQRYYDKNTGHTYYEFSNHELFDISLVQMVNRILPLAGMHDYMKLFHELHGNINKSLQMQGFCDGLFNIRKQYYSVLNMIENELADNNVDIQKLWYYLQTPIKIMENVTKLLRDIDKKKKNPLSVLYTYLTTAIDREIYNIYDFLMQKTIQPFIMILGKWIYYGILDDPHTEFFVEEKRSEKFAFREQQKLMEDFWEEKYSLNKNKVPVFLESISEKIYLTGKYVNVIRSYTSEQELNHNTTLLDNYVFTTYNEDLRIAVEGAFKWANAELMNIIFKRENLKVRLLRIKEYFFLGKGDLFVHFMDLCESTLTKQVKEISLESLQNMMEQSIRTSTASNDKYKDSLSCSLSLYSTNELLQAFQHYNGLKGWTRKQVEQKMNVSNLNSNKRGYETFDIDYSLTFPLNLIITKSVILRYQILFRYLFMLKFAERELNSTWLCFKHHREVASNQIIKLSLSLIQRMLHFCKTLSYHFVYEVIEKHWVDFMTNLDHKASVFEDIIGFQDKFLQNCYHDTMLLDKRFKSIIWNLLVSFLFTTDKVKKFLNSYVTLDYKSIIVS